MRKKRCSYENMNAVAKIQAERNAKALNSEMRHSLHRSLFRSRRSLVRLLRTARFARALRSAYSFARSLTYSLLNSRDGGIFFSIFLGFLNHCALVKVGDETESENGSSEKRARIQSGSEKRVSESVVVPNAKRPRNKAGYKAIRCVLARTDSSFGQKRHFRVVSARV